MESTRFEYVSYLATSPEKIWKALIDPEIAAQYWYNVNVSDWRAGSRWEHRSGTASGDLLMAGRVVESVPPRRLVLTWTFPTDSAPEESQSRVTIDLEQLRGVVRLTLTHDRLVPGSEMHEGIVEGWPKVISSLKSLLETGRPLPRLW